MQIRWRIIMISMINCPCTEFKLKEEIITSDSRGNNSAARRKRRVNYKFLRGTAEKQKRSVYPKSFRFGININEFWNTSSRANSSNLIYGQKGLHFVELWNNMELEVWEQKRAKSWNEEEIKGSSWEILEIYLDVLVVVEVRVLNHNGSKIFSIFSSKSSGR